MELMPRKNSFFYSFENTPLKEIDRAQKKRIDYYPFGLEHQKADNTASSSNLGQNWKYQGQERSEDLGLIIDEWKYRISDPSIGRFWQLDPLAEDYVYNSTYAFQENKLGLGIELEGAELLKRVEDATAKISKGANKLLNNETFGEAQRQMTSSKNIGKSDQINNQGHLTRTESINEISEGIGEASVGVVNIAGTAVENTGDVISTIGILTAQPEVIALGEGIEAVGVLLNVGVDLLDGKSIGQIAVERAPSILLGQAGKQTVKSITKAGGGNNVTESIIKAHEKTYSTIIENKMSVKIEPIKYEEKK